MNPDPEAGVADLMEVHARSQGAELCILGYHAWVPWLEVAEGSSVTWCCRDGCDARQQYDL